MDEPTENTWPFISAGQTNVLVTGGGKRLDSSENTQERCSVLFRYVFLAFVGIALYAGTIAVDIWVALEDINKGDLAYAIINLTLVATPSVLFGLYMFFTAFTKFNGSDACCNAILWLLFIPLIPLFPVMRIPVRICHALAAACHTQKQSLHMSLLSKPSSAHLLKFLQALVASAPQLVLRIHKVLALDDDDKPFANMGSLTPLEWTQVGLASAAVVLTVSLAVGKTPCTRGLFDGSLALESINKRSVVLALIWWIFFLAARIPCIALLIYSFEYWSLVFLILHCPLIIALQKNEISLQPGRTIFIYLFSAFLFIFVYIEVNLTRRMRSAWTPHAIFSALALVEQSAILGFWFLVERQIIPKVTIFPPEILYKNDTLANTNSQNGTAYFGLIEHDETVLSVHYLLFTLSAAFMAITFCCRSRS